MGMAKLPEHVQQLLESGRPPSTPAALVEWGTTGQHRALYSDLGRLAEAAQGMGAPAVLVVGEVVKLAERLAWRKEGALPGLPRAGGTGPRHQAERARRVAAGGGGGAGGVFAGEDHPPSGGTGASARALGPAVGVGALHLREWPGRLSRRSLSGGAGCARAGRNETRCGRAGDRAGLRGDGSARGFVPTCALADSLAEELPEIGPEHACLLVRAQEARSVLPETLTQRDPRVETLDVYRTEPDPHGAALLARLLSEEPPDLITLTSASAARALVEAAGIEAVRDIPTAAIGPITGETARQLGLQVVVTAEEHTMPGLVKAVVAWKERQR